MLSLSLFLYFLQVSPLAYLCHTLCMYAVLCGTHIHTHTDEKQRDFAEAAAKRNAERDSRHYFCRKVAAPHRVLAVVRFAIILFLSTRSLIMKCWAFARTPLIKRL